MPNDPAHQGVIDAVYRAIETTPKALARVALYMAQNPDRVVAQSISEIGESAGSGQATIIRFCKFLGFEGFRDFKLALAREIERDRVVREAAHPIDRQTVRHPRLAAIAAALQSALSASAVLIDPAQVETIAERMLAARRVELYGVGVSMACADLLASRLLWLGIPIGTAKSDLIARGIAGTLGPESVAMGISYSGISAETVAFVETARDSGAYCIAVTTRTESTLARTAHDTLLLSQAGPWPEAGSARLIPSVALLAEFLADRIQVLRANR